MSPGSGFEVPLDRVIARWLLLGFVLLLLPVPLFLLGRAVMWLALPKAEFEQVLLAGSWVSVWLGGWAVLAGTGAGIARLTTGSWARACIAACFGTLLGFAVLGVGIGVGASKELSLSKSERAAAVADARQNSYPWPSR